MNTTHSIHHSAHPACRLPRLASLLMSALALLGMAACETGGGFSTLSGEGRAERQADRGNFSDAAASYIGLATEAQGSERDRLTLLAVEQWLNAGDIVRARRAFGNIVEPVEGPLRTLWQSNRAAFALYDGDADAALTLLEPMSREPLLKSNRLRTEALRADAWFQKGDPARAVGIMVQRETWLDSSRQISAGRQRLWNGLTVSRPDALRESADASSDEIVAGWLQLGALAASTGQQGIGWANGVQRWREQHADHPAMVIVDDFDIEPVRAGDYPRQIALLLPLSGQSARAGQAIQHGFLGAYFNTADALDGAQAVRVYDVVAEGGAIAAYDTAVLDGAEFVVGPLLRSNVDELANNSLVPVPVLTLNYLPPTTLPPPGLFQFALAPEDEAAAAAERAIADGHRRAVALIPNSNWGRRVFESFATTFEGLGGTVLDQRSYTTGTPDFSKTIEDLMSLSGSVNRYQRLRANIGGPLQFDPRRRADAEFVFLAADATNGRLLKSQLKFHYSGDLPVYSTASIYARDGRSDADLNGVMFANMPWIIDPQSWFEDLPEKYSDFWPQQRRLNHLHAMGYDAYRLVAPLFASDRESLDGIDGVTGELFLDLEGRVHRRLSWAQFQGGEVVALPRHTGLDTDERDDDVPAFRDERLSPFEGGR